MREDRHGQPRNDGPIEQLAFGNAYVRLLREPGLIDMPGEEHMMTEQAQAIIRRQYTEIMDLFVKDFGIGFYQFTMSQIPLVGSIWTAVTGTDILGHKVEGWERVVAALDAAGQAATMGLPIAFQREFAASSTTPRIVQRGLGEVPVVEDIMRAPAGTRIANVEDFGMDRAQVREFRQVLEKHSAALAENSGVAEQKIYAGVRTGKDALGRASEGIAGKSELIKSKTADANDVAGGWSPETGPATYVTPEQVTIKLGLTPEQIITKVVDPVPQGFQVAVRRQGGRRRAGSLEARRPAHRRVPRRSRDDDRGDQSWSRAGRRTRAHHRHGRLELHP